MESTTEAVNGTSSKPDAYQLRLVWSEEKQIWYALLWSGLDNKCFEVGGPNLGKVTHAIRKTILEHEAKLNPPEPENLIVMPN